MLLMRDKIPAVAIMVLAAVLACHSTLRARPGNASQQTLPALALQQEPPPSESRSVWDGVYTEDQAKRGETVYTKECASCHGDNLIGGGGASPLTGGAFLSNWNGLTLSDLFDRIRKTMPQGSPGKLTKQQTADVLAYLLSFNKFPAGKTELSRQSEFLKEIRFDATKPDANK